MMVGDFVASGVTHNDGLRGRYEVCFIFYCFTQVSLETM